MNISTMKLVAFISLKTEERKLHNETVFNMFWVHIYIRSNIIKSGKISTHHAIQLKLFFNYLPHYYSITINKDKIQCM